MMPMAMVSPPVAPLRPTAPPASPDSLLETTLPEFEFRGAVSRTIHASPEQIFRALREVTLADMPLAYALGTVRYLPGLLTGRLKRRPDEATRPFLEVVAPVVLAEEPDHEIVFGSIGKLHDLLDQRFVVVPDARAFAAFALSGYEKLAESFRIVGGDAAAGYRVVFEHRTHALGTGARRKFALYWWLLIKWGSAVLLWLLLNAVQRRAERLAACAA